MKKYENPKMNVSLFEAENVVTASGDNAQQQAMTEARNMENSKGTFVVKLTF